MVCTKYLNTYAQQCTCHTTCNNFHERIKNKKHWNNKTNKKARNLKIKKLSGWKSGETVRSFDRYLYQRESILQRDGTFYRGVAIIESLWTRRGTALRTHRKKSDESIYYAKSIEYRGTILSIFPSNLEST